jgi:diglucosylglycerate octanoyltransferase
MRHLVVLGDSLSFHGPDGPLPLADERLYPQRLERLLAAATGSDWRTSVVARAGWCVRDVWLALQKDVHLQQQVLLGADAVVLAATSADALTVGFPRLVTFAVNYLRPPTLRRRVRRELDRAHPHLVRLTGERLRWTPSEVYRHCWRKSIGGLRLFAPDAALCAILPSPHDAPYYAHSMRHLAAGIRETEEVAAELEVPLVDLPAIVTPFLDRLNRDGVHWPFEVHERVAAGMAEALLPQLGAGNGHAVHPWPASTAASRPSSSASSGRVSSARR